MRTNIAICIYLCIRIHTCTYECFHVRVYIRTYYCMYICMCVCRHPILYALPIKVAVCRTVSVSIPSQSSLIRTYARHAFLTRSGRDWACALLLVVNISPDTIENPRTFSTTISVTQYLLRVAPQNPDEFQPLQNHSYGISNRTACFNIYTYFL